MQEYDGDTLIKFKAFRNTYQIFFFAHNSQVSHFKLNVEDFSPSRYIETSKTNWNYFPCIVEHSSSFKTTLNLISCLGSTIKNCKGYLQMENVKPRFFVNSEM